MSIKRTFDQKNELIYAIHHFSVNADSREIFLQGDVDNTDKEQSEIDYCSATAFLKNFRYLLSLDKNKPIFIHLMTVGGDWDAGIAIYDSIRTCSTPTAMFVHGQAYSMGSVILQAVTTRIMMPNSNFMLHEGGIEVCGTVKTGRSYMEYEKRIGDKMMDIYLEKCIKGEMFQGKKRNEVKKYIQSKFDKKEDWYLNAEETVQYGLADVVLGKTTNFLDISSIIN